VDGVCVRCGKAEPNIPDNLNWVSTWATAEENFTASTDRVPNTLNGTTVRQIIRVTTSGETMKLKFSNQYGNTDVVVRSLHIAKQVQADKSTIDVSTDTVVTVNGAEEFVIPRGQTIETDPVHFPVSALENVAVSMYFGNAPTTAATITGHRGARATTYQGSGNQVSNETLNANKTILSWYFLCDVALDMPEGSRAIVCFGDSITDGYGTDASYLNQKPDQYTRWGDYFAKRLQADENTKNVSVLNEGIGSNGMLSSYPTDSGRDRYARDLLEHDGVEYVIILFGVNDLQKLNNTNKYEQLRVEFEKMITLAHEHGIKVYAAPILPFGKYSDYYSENSERVRTMLNDWFRSADSHVDGIIDFESAVADPSDPKCILPAYTSDGLHPHLGYNVMADAIDLTLFYK
jgi:lysophospholipase L1-like esterase